MRHKSRRYLELEAQVESEYYTEPSDPLSRAWWQKVGSKWRNRVGRARLTAEAAAWEASRLLGDVNAGMHRNEPELQKLLGAARTATHAYVAALSRDSWARFSGEKTGEASE